MRRRLRIVFVVVVVLVVVFGLLTARLFVWPTVDRPTNADAIVVLGGDGDRLEKGLSLARAGLAPNLLVAIDKYPGSPCQDPSRLDLGDVALYCFVPDPFTTRGEARYIADMADQRGWNHVIVVSNTAQDTRARLRIGRCWSGDLSVVTVQPDALRSVRDILHEWGGMAKALTVERSC